MARKKSKLIKGLVHLKMKISLCFTSYRCIWLSSFRRIQSELYYKLSWLFQALSLQWVGVSVQHIFIMDARALFDVFWTFEQKHPPTAMITLGITRTIFNITPIGFVWKKKVIYTYRMPRGWVKHRLIFIFGWTNPLRWIKYKMFFRVTTRHMHFFQCTLNVLNWQL